MSDSTPPWPSPFVAWYGVAILTFAYLVSFVDRQILPLLIEPIKASFHISDTQVSLLGGFAFVTLFTVVGVPVAWLADHRNRRAIILVGIAFWSVMTALTGIAGNFWQMFLARVGVGVGEATLSPSAFSIMSDSFPPARLAKPMSVYMAGGAVGGGLALIVGGAILAATAHLPSLALPLVGALQPWQLAFLIVSLPGLLCVLLALTLREPARRGGLKASGAAAGAASPRVAIAYMRGKWPVFAPLFSGFALLALFKNAILVWAPTMYVRSYGLTLGEIGFAYGLFLIVFGTLGGFGSGWLVDRLRQRGILDGGPRVTVITMALSVPVAVAMPLMPNVTGSLAMLAALTMLTFMSASVVPTAFQLVTPNQMRAQTSAIIQLFNNLLGAGVGPTMVALITDHVFHDEGALRYSMVIVSLLIGPLATICFWLGLKPFKAESARFEEIAALVEPPVAAEA